MPFRSQSTPLWTLAVLFVLAGRAPLFAAEVQNKLAVGVAYTGIQLHWGFANKWAVEARALKGEADTDAGNIESDAYGLRLYRYFRRPSRLRFFAGLEAASTRSSATDTSYETKGFAGGGFLGAELYLMKRFSVGLDAGPYFISSKVRDSDTSESETTFVLNTFMNFYFL